MSSKVLTIIIPMYNTELYLPRCLDSLLYDNETNKDLEVIIVNDGSTDGSLEVAKRYEKQFSGTVSVIDKENGGHGSTINSGLAAATGKYLKVIDSDDWVNIWDFPKFVKKLSEIDDDVVVTNFQQNILYAPCITDVNFYHDNDGSRSMDDIEEIMSTDDEHYSLSMHSLTVKTAALQSVWDEGLLEHTFYVDMQFVTKVLECAKTFRTLDYMIYMYFIGRPEQSITDFFKRRDNHERVLRWLLEEMNGEKIRTNESAAKALRKLIDTMLETHYEAYYRTLKATRDELKELLAFDNFLKAEYPEAHSTVAAAKNIRRRLSPTRRLIKRKMLAK